jgi:hypothetical protein
MRTTPPEPRSECGVLDENDSLRRGYVNNYFKNDPENRRYTNALLTNEER